MKLLLPVFMLASVASQLTVVSPIAKVVPETGAQVGVNEPSTTSDAEAVKVTTAPEGPVASTVVPGGTITVGAVVSCTVTMKLLLPVFRLASVASQLTVVSPIAKVEPETGVQSVVNGPSTISNAEVIKLTTAPEGPVASTVVSGGTVTSGGVRSRTVTMKLLLPVFRLASVASQLTVVSPIAKVEAETGVQVTGNEPSPVSVAVATKLTTAPEAEVASVTMSNGKLSSGAIVSLRTLPAAYAVHPAASVTQTRIEFSPSARFVPAMNVFTWPGVV